ncbi:MAG: DNA primase [Candidatus Liberibacter europaeus]|uniref:DNA primase n=1 Tax=Candidatus Liberibacter europaeus TaxID=744859 RepID=A0A2T4VXE1_9HYPH|nr:DNA primase [Candidatus Liberibacter europaeus]PTL86428.1 MAG: DNA primase [Candidatus Liberibacter europaeus]
MLHYTNDFIKDLLTRISISDLIGQYVNWDRKKTNYSKGDYWTCCPFHEEKTPSFHCDNQKGLYYCFSCHANGDHLAFLSSLLGLSFIESVEKLADIAGIPLPIYDHNLAKKEIERSSLIDIIEIATQFFQESLKKYNYGRLRYYLDERGINDSSIKTFRLGYAPNSRQALGEYLRGKGISQEQTAKVGLIVQGENISTPYDRFRDRIIFPILSSRGQVIGFGGRSISKADNIKYMNSPETIFFHKGKNLYNFFRVLNNRRRLIGDDAKRNNSSTVVIVEGYMDVISLHQAGIQNVVSSLGTALTDNQLKLLWRLSSRVVVCFDGDDPGLRATYKVIDIVLANLILGKSVNFILLPDGDDPDRFVLRHGKNSFEKLIIESLSLVDLLWKRETECNCFETPDARAELEMRFKKSIDLIPDKKLRYYYSQEIQYRLTKFFRQNQLFDYSYGKYWKQNSKYKDKSRPSKRLMQSSLVTGKLSQKPSLREATLLLTLIHHPQLIQEEYQNLIDISYDNIELQKMWTVLFSEFIMSKEFSREEIHRKLCNRGFGELLIKLDKQIRDAGLWSATATANIIDVREGYKQALKLYKRSRLLSRQKEDIENKIAEMTEQGEEKKTNILMSILHDIHIQINKIEHQAAMIEGFGKMSGRVNGISFP